MFENMSEDCKKFIEECYSLRKISKVLGLTVPQDYKNYIVKCHKQGCFELTKDFEETLRTGVGTVIVGDTETKFHCYLYDGIEWTNEGICLRWNTGKEWKTRILITNLEIVALLPLVEVGEFKKF